MGGDELPELFRNIPFVCLVCREHLPLASRKYREEVIDARRSPFKLGNGKPLARELRTLAEAGIDAAQEGAGWRVPLSLHGNRHQFEVPPE
jgi:hypothetical protein